MLLTGLSGLMGPSLPSSLPRLLCSKLRVFDKKGLSYLGLKGPWPLWAFLHACLPPPQEYVSRSGPHGRSSFTAIYIFLFQ